jgi:hypothetical protein
VTEDPFDTDEWRAYAKHALDDLVPKLRNSAVAVQLVPDGPTDVKFALELGMSIMLDKPIIAVFEPGTRVPAKLVAVADALVEGSLSDPTTAKRIKDALHKVLGR